MRVILLKTIKDLGKEGDTVEVADGHARNFLFPKHLAVPATAAALDDLASQAEAERKQAERELHDLQRLAEEIDDAEFVVSAKANEEGALYGAIGVPEVIATLGAAGHDVAPAWVRLEEPIKDLGEHTLHLELPHGLEADIRLIVEAEQA